MQSLVNRWNKHLAENNMTYREHWLFAVSHGISCIFAGIYLIIHGFLPCFYRHTGSELVHQLEKDFNNHANRHNKEKAKINTYE